MPKQVPRLDIRWRQAGRKLAVNGFGDDKAQHMREAIVEPLAPMRCRIAVAEDGFTQTSPSRT